MSLTYSGLSTYGKATLPSVENWGANMYIVKDPHKSIHTRKIEKVSDTNFMLNEQADSADRVSECISVYARGVNPFVSVNYSNQGNNTQGGGSLVGNSLGSGGQSYLPYRIMKDGAFRYPQKSKSELLALSRQARQTTSAFSQAGFADYTKKLMCPEEEYREIKKEMIKTDIRPTATYNLGSSVEHFDVKYVIKNPVKFDSHAGNTGVRTRDLTMTDVKEPLKQINTNHLNVFAETIKGSNFHTLSNDNSHFNTNKYIQENPLNVQVDSRKTRNIQSTPIEEISTTKYIQENPLNVQVDSRKTRNIQSTPIEEISTTKYIQENPLHANAQTQKTQNLQITPIDELFNTDKYGEMFTKESLNTSYDTVKTSYSKHENIHKDMDLQRRVLSTSVVSNKGENIHVRSQHEYQKEQKNNRPSTNASTNHGTTSIQQGFELTSRKAKLHPTLSLGQFEGKAQMPLQAQNNSFHIDDSERTIRNKKILEMQMNRH
jgi:hypothetical protein